MKFSHANLYLKKYMETSDENIDVDYWDLKGSNWDLIDKRAPSKEENKRQLAQVVKVLELLSAGPEFKSCSGH